MLEGRIITDKNVEEGERIKKDEMWREERVITDKHVEKETD
jgi:hypothetical protein